MKNWSKESKLIAIIKETIYINYILINKIYLLILRIKSIYLMYRNI